MKLPETRFEKAVKYLPADIIEAVREMPASVRDNIQEIRLRLGKPISFTSYGKTFEYSDIKELKYILLPEDMKRVFEKICDYSLHSHEAEIRSGFVTVDGGHRIGFCGTKSDCTVKDITSINIRIAGEIPGCGREIAKLYEAQKKSILIAGPPLSGKTTVVRDVTRIIGNSAKVALIDERSEIAATFDGEAQNDVGKFTDVLNEYSKLCGIETATRVLSPELIICDEIGNKEEVKEIISSVNSGVKFIATIHSDGIEEFLSKKYVRKMIKNKIFHYIVLLDTGNSIGQIKQIINTEDFIDENCIGNIDNNLRVFSRKYICK